MLISAVLLTATRAISANSFGGNDRPPASTTSSSGPLDFSSFSGGTSSEQVSATST